MSTIFCPSFEFEQACCTSGVDGGVNEVYGARPLVNVLYLRTLRRVYFFLFYHQLMCIVYLYMVYFKFCMLKLCSLTILMP